MSQIRQYLNIFKVSDKKEVQSFLSVSLSINYTISGLQKLLDRIGFSYQTIHKLPGKCPIDAQKQWVKNFENKLATKSDNEVILLMDGVHPTHDTKYSKIWAQKGQSRYIQSNTGREGHICGAYNPSRTFNS